MEVVFLAVIQPPAPNQAAAPSSGSAEPKTEMDALLDLLDSQYPAVTPADKLFLKRLRVYIRTHQEKKDKNHDAYFNSNKNAGVWQFLLSVLEAFRSSPVLLGILIWAILSGLSVLYTPAGGFPPLLQAVLGVISFAVALISARQNLRRRTLLLRRYGETWVRHTCMLTKYNDEILRYLSASPPYSTLTPEEQKQLFQERIFELSGENLNRFSTNMQKISEYIE